MSRIRSRLTYANVISTLCLVLLVGGGTAVAASQFGKETIGSRALKKESIGPNKLNPAAKAALQGPAGAKGAIGATGPAGPGGPAGPAGAPGSALAFAHVNADGSLDDANSKNVTVSKNAALTGYYCVSATVPTRNVIATAADTISPRVIVSSFNDPFTSCPDGAAVIQTWDSAAKPINAPFFVVFN